MASSHIPDSGCSDNLGPRVEMIMVAKSPTNPPWRRDFAQNHQHMGGVCYRSITWLVLRGIHSLIELTALVSPRLNSTLTFLPHWHVLFMCLCVPLQCQLDQDKFRDHPSCAFISRYSTQDLPRSGHQYTIIVLLLARFFSSSLLCG